MTTSWKQTSSRQQPDLTPLELACAAPPSRGPAALIRLHVENGVSLWLDHVSRQDLTSGSLAQMIAAGVRGAVLNETELARSLEESTDYEEQISALLDAEYTAQEALVEVAATDAQVACALLLRVYELSQGTDGFVTLDVAGACSGPVRATLMTICELHQRIDRPNLLVGVQATTRGVRALHAAVAAGCNVNMTRIFSIARYATVLEAYQSGLEALIARGGDPSTVHGCATFSLPPVDIEVDRRLKRLDYQDSPELRGQAAIAQATLARQLFEERFATKRWAHLASCGATPHRLVWECRAPDGDVSAQQYLEALNIPGTIQVISGSAMARLETDGLRKATCVKGPQAASVLSALGALHIDLDDVAAELEKGSSARALCSLADAVDRLSETLKR